MKNQSKHRSRSTAFVLLLAIGGIFASASPAAAHDELVETTPAADTTVSSLPSDIELSFSAELLNEGDSTVVEVTDSTGGDLTNGDPVVDGATVTQPVAGTSDGIISVVWRVVSSDGHPISGDFTFTVEAAPTPMPTPTPTEVVPTTEPETAAPTATAEPTVIIVEDSGSSTAAWVIGGLLVLLAIAGTVIIVLARRKSKKNTEPTASDTDAPSSES